MDLSRNNDNLGNERKSASKYICYVFEDNHGVFSTFIQPYEENDPERDAAPNMKFYRNMFIGDTIQSVQKEASKYIIEVQNSKKLTDYDIIQLSQKRTESSYIQYGNDQRIDIIGVDEMKKLGIPIEEEF